MQFDLCFDLGQGFFTDNQWEISVSLSKNICYYPVTAAWRLVYF